MANMLNEICGPCREAIELDEVAILDVDGRAEPAVIACDQHLRRIVLAIEVLDALEQVEQIEIPPLVEVSFASRLIVAPERRS
jgi:hypothetical protein